MLAVIEDASARRAAEVIALPSPRASQHPVAVYLASVATGSQRTLEASLTIIACTVVTGNPAITCWDVPWQEMRYQHVTAVRAQLAARYKFTTCNKMLSALRGVLKACWRLGLMSGEDYQLARSVEAVTGTSLPAGREITAGERAALLEACYADPTPLGRRDAALFALLYGCGLRRAEVAALDVADYDATRQCFTLVGKRNKQRTAYVSASGVSEALADWLAVRGDAPGALFTRFRRGGHPQSGRMSAQAIYDALLKRAEHAGIPPLSPHDFRRTFIGDLLDRGADIATVAKMAGHANVTTTARYDRRPEEAKRKAAALLHVPYRKVVTPG